MSMKEIFQLQAAIDEKGISALALVLDNPFQLSSSFFGEVLVSMLLHMLPVGFLSLIFVVAFECFFTYILLEFIGIVLC